MSTAWQVEIAGRTFSLDHITELIARETVRLEQDIPAINPDLMVTDPMSGEQRLMRADELDRHETQNRLCVVGGNELRHLEQLRLAPGQIHAGIEESGQLTQGVLPLAVKDILSTQAALGMSAEAGLTAGPEAAEGAGVATRADPQALLQRSYIPSQRQETTQSFTM